MPKKLAPGIYVYNSEQLSNCIDAIKNNIELFLTDGALVSKNVEGNPQGSYVDLSIRKVKVFSVGAISSCHQDDPINVFSRNLEKIGGECLNAYRTIHAMGSLLKNHEWQVMKYDEGSFFKNHIDDSVAHSRTVSVVAYFNDDYDGGEIEFSGFDVSYKPQSGDILIFPSSFIYNHSVKEITRGVRYAAVNWFSYAKLNK